MLFELKTKITRIMYVRAITIKIVIIFSVDIRTIMYCKKTQNSNSDAVPFDNKMYDIVFVCVRALIFITH